jgi:hypothetical protein
MSPPIDEVGEERQFHHLRTNILAPAKQSRLNRRRYTEKTDLARSEDQRKDQVADPKDRTTQVAITFEAPPVWE